MGAARNATGNAVSLFNLSLAYEAMRMRVRMAEDQVRDFSELSAQYFLEDNEGAKEFLVEVAKMHREDHPIVNADTGPNTGDKQCP